MCLVVWVAAARPLPVTTLPDRRKPDPVSGYHQIVPAAPDAVLRARSSLPFVSEVGSHEGCGCGYNSGGPVGEGFATPERLRDLVCEALRSGPVEVFGCWSGDEGQPAIGVLEVVASHARRMPAARPTIETARLHRSTFPRKFVDGKWGRRYKWTIALQRRGRSVSLVRHNARPCMRPRVDRADVRVDVVAPPPDTMPGDL